MTRLAIVTTHPIQYQAPWFRAMSSHSELDAHVFFCHRVTPVEQAAAGFGVEFEWDRPLLSGYQYSFLKNVAKTPTVAGFAGLDTPEIKSIISRGRYDAVLVNGWHYKAAWQAILTCWRTKTRVMVRGDSHLHTQRPLWKKAVKRITHGQFIPRFDACLAVGTWSREYYLHYGARPNRIFLVPHAVENGWFTSQSLGSAPQRAELRSQWGLDNDRVVFLFVGKFIEKKRPKDFVEAIGLAVRSGANVCGLMIGDGPLRSACEEFVTRNNISVRFAGFLNQTQIPKAYMAADCLVLLSDGGETWGLVVNEAMTCGLPAIISDRVGCGPDLIDPGVTGDIFPMGNVERLAIVMSEWSEPMRCRSASIAVGKKIGNYSIERAVRGTLDALRFVSCKRDKSDTVLQNPTIQECK
jgi:glycosyltransferase involved in cell wall biosynthesis